MELRIWDVVERGTGDDRSWGGIRVDFHDFHLKIRSFYFSFLLYQVIKNLQYLIKNSSKQKYR